jgi:hypothetical protein
VVGRVVYRIDILCRSTDIALTSCWKTGATLITLVEGVRRAQINANILFSTDMRKLKTGDVLSAFEGDNRLKKVLWKDVKGVPISKLSVVHGLCKARGEYKLPLDPTLDWALRYPKSRGHSGKRISTQGDADLKLKRPG